MIKYCAVDVILDLSKFFLSAIQFILNCLKFACLLHTCTLTVGQIYHCMQGVSHLLCFVHRLSYILSVTTG